ncbi:hypothetical protein [Lysinibacillus sp. 54212]|uniref:hypothetical protein n=1 Tax=Lysinibacillus sp. 54212 TaxID=3119829 RepID=UPI002FCC4531
MKRLFLAAGIIFLASCTDKEVTEPRKDKEEDQSVVYEAEQKRNRQLSAVLERVAVDYGIMRKDPVNITYEFGLVYADLIDLNEDGQDELYVVLNSGANFDEELTHRNQDGYIVEIWAANEQQAEAELLHNEVIRHDSSDTSLAFVKTTHGDIFLKNHVQGKNNETTTYYAYRDEGWEVVLEASISGGTLHRIDGVDVDLAQFEGEMKEFQGEEFHIVKGDEGLAVDMSNIAEHIGGVFSALTKDSHAILADGEDAPDDVFAKIEKAMGEHSDYRKMDKRDRETYERTIVHLILRGKLTYDGQLENQIPSITESQVVQKMKELFDIELDRAAMNLPPQEDLDVMDMLRYEEGVFYLPISEFYSDTIIRDVGAAKRFEEDLYLVTFQDHFISVMEYTISTNDYDFNPETYKTTSVSEWPEKTQPFIKEGIPSYAVVKVTDEGVKLYYMGYVNLSEEELRSF